MSAPDTHRTVLLTNDDGIDAPGLEALERSLAGLTASSSWLPIASRAVPPTR